jgi:hypothetical protein
MLIQFSVQNFKSFKSGITLSMEAEPITEHAETHVFVAGKRKLLKSALIYGANASGKSNLINAIEFMRKFVLDSVKYSNFTDDIEVVPFRLHTETEHQPSIFEAVFQLGARTYRYGFSVNMFSVQEEWLYQDGKLLFERDKWEIQCQFEEGKGLEKRTRHNALFLSVVANFNGEISQKIQSWFKNVRIISDPHKVLIDVTFEMLKYPDEKAKILKLLEIADFGIEDLEVEAFTLDSLEVKEKLSKYNYGMIPRFTSIYSHRVQFDEQGFPSGKIKFSIDSSESAGTRKFLAMLGLILNVLNEGGVMVIDELDNSLHPKLTREIVKMFNSYDMNKTNAQLIGSTHDIQTLNRKLLRRDQIWFVEKDRYGASTLYSLADIRDEHDNRIRKDASYDKDYMLGKYGAIPHFGSWSLALGDDHGET